MQEPSSRDPADDEASPLKALLTATVCRRIKEAKDARQASGIEEIWDEDADQYDGIDELSARARGGVKDANNRAKTDQKSTRSRVYLNITKPKTDIAVARIQEMLVPHDDKPWGIEPTPIPEFLDAVDANSQEPVTLADGTQAPAEQVAQVAMQRATNACKKMADWIEDRLVEGDVYAELRNVIRDAGRLGTGILKGPFPVAKQEKRWDVASGVAVLQMRDKTVPTSKRKDPRDCFPDPACGDDIHNGSYFVERDYITPRQLRRLAKVMNEDGSPAYDTEAIAQALKEGPNSRSRHDGRNRTQDGDTVGDSDVFELYYYYGEVEPETLLEMGVDQAALREEDLYLSSVPSIVTMLNDKPIKVAINPLETGEFPFDFFPWEPVEGQPWGRGVPRKMAVPQRVLNGGVRALLENAGLSAGPQIAITEGALLPVDGNYAITGRKLWKFVPNEMVSDITKAMQVWNIPSAQVELSNIITFALQMADELTNLPMLMQGQQGSAPELLGGMQMLMNNASAPLRVIAKQFDDCLIIPHLRRYYDWGMQSGPEGGKGDMQVVARGSSALVQREIAREFLIQAHGLAQRPNSRIDPDKLDAELFKAHGMSFSSIEYDKATWEQMQKAKQQQPPPQDPRIEAANIRAQSAAQQVEARAAEAQQRMQFEAAEAEKDRALQSYVKNLEFQIQAMEFAGQKEISFAQLKAMLATKTIDSRDKRELFLAERALKMDPGNPTNQGV